MPHHTILFHIVNLIGPPMFVAYIGLMAHLVLSSSAFERDE